MLITTRKADQRARIVLPDDFANETVVIEMKRAYVPDRGDNTLKPIPPE